MTKKIVCFKIDSRLLRILDMVAERERKNRSEVIREAIDKYIKPYKQLWEQE